MFSQDKPASIATERKEYNKRITELEKEVAGHKATIKTLLKRLNKADPEVLDLRFEAAELRAALELFADADNWVLIEGDHAGDTYMAWIHVSDPRKIVKQALALNKG